MSYIIRTDNAKLLDPGYFVGRCGSGCVSFDSDPNGVNVKRFDTDAEAFDEIDWLPEKAGPYSVVEVTGDVKANDD
jgi:hypothetical protein